MVLVNILANLHQINNIDGKWGMDYWCYIEQATAFVMGETDYYKFGSTLGPAFYPGGHILLFTPMSLLHFATENAEMIIRAFFIGVGIATHGYAVKIAYLYYKEDNGDFSHQPW